MNDVAELDVAAHCVVEVVETPEERFYARCTTHRGRGIDVPHSRMAHSAFLCDPLGQRFVVATSDDPTSPAVVDLSRLRSLVWRWARDRSRGLDLGELICLKWTPADPWLVPLSVSRVPVGDDGVQWRIHAGDGTHILTLAMTDSIR